MMIPQLPAGAAGRGKITMNRLDQHMTSILRKFRWLIPICAIIAFVAFADDEPPRDIAPLQQLFDAIHDEYRGRILEVELDDDDDGWIYEVKLLTVQGHVLKLEYDAHSLALLEVKGRRDHSDD